MSLGRKYSQVSEERRNFFQLTQGHTCTRVFIWKMMNREEQPVRFWRFQSLQMVNWNSGAYPEILHESTGALIGSSFNDRYPVEKSVIITGKFTRLAICQKQKQVYFLKYWNLSSKLKCVCFTGYISPGREPTDETSKKPCNFTRTHRQDVSLPDKMHAGISFRWTALFLEYLLNYGCFSCLTAPWRF